MFFIRCYQKMLKIKIKKTFDFKFKWKFKRINKLISFFFFSIFSVFFNIFKVLPILIFQSAFFYFFYFILPFKFQKQFRLTFSENIVLTEYEFLIEFFRDLRRCNRLMVMIRKYNFLFLC